MKTRTALWAIPLISMLALPAMAGHRQHNDNRYNQIDKRMDRQHLRIKKGVRKGQLTRWETRKLRKQQRRIADLRYRFLRDGRLDRFERRKLNYKLDKASDRIYRFKHNNDYRYRTQRTPARHHQRYRQDDRSRWTISLNWSDFL